MTIFAVLCENKTTIYILQKTKGLIIIWIPLEPEDFKVICCCCLFFLHIYYLSTEVNNAVSQMREQRLR